MRQVYELPFSDGSKIIHGKVAAHKYQIDAINPDGRTVFEESMDLGEALAFAGSIIAACHQITNEFEVS